MGMMRTTFWVGAVSCGLTLLQSGRLIAKHRRHWHNPQQQRCIVVIISSVPIFAVNAFVSLLILRGSKTVGLHAPEWLDLVLDGAKECYEAFGPDALPLPFLRPSPFVCENCLSAQASGHFSS